MIQCIQELGHTTKLYTIDKTNWNVLNEIQSLQMNNVKFSEQRVLSELKPLPLKYSRKTYTL